MEAGLGLQSAAPALVVVFPAVMAVLVLLLGRRALLIVPLVTIPVSLGLAGTLARGVLREGSVLVMLGGWESPLGILLRADGLAAAFVAMTAVVASAIAFHLLAEDRRGRQRKGFSSQAAWALFLFLWAGLNAVFLSNDLFNLYVALELTSLSGVALVALAGSAAALRAQLRYLLYAAVGSLLYLMGVALLYAELGVLDLALAGRALAATAPVQAALILMTVGLLVKTAIWPLHFWLPAAHSTAPAPISAALSGLVVKASLYLLIRLWFDVFAPVLNDLAWSAMAALGAIAVLWGSLLALRQERMKMMIAYSTVAQLGYMLFVFPLAVAGGSAAREAWTGGVLVIIAHGIAKASMFLAAGAIIAALGSDEREKLAGASRRVPVPIFAFALAGLSIMALPPSGGFLGKWLLLRSAMTAGEWTLAAVLVVGGLLAAGYVLKFLIPAFRPVPEGASVEPLPSGLLGVGAMLLALVSVALGLAAGPVARLLEIGTPSIVAGGT